MKAPSTTWKEQVTADEEQRFAGYAEQLSQIQAKASQQYGKGRALHRKQLCAAHGTFEVLPNLPAHALHGLFKTPQVYPATIRLSNGSMKVQADKVPDIRGFAIKVRDVNGPGALGGTTLAQDFLLINREVFGLKNSEEFIGLVLGAAAGGAGLLTYFFRQFGLIGGFGQLISTVKSLGKPFTGFATERFFSAAPIACGPYAARVRLLPASHDVDAKASADWGLDFRQRLARGPLAFDFQLQFFVDEATTPIEDGRKNWEETDAPYVTVARLTLPRQDLAGDKAATLDASVNRDAFDPWCALLDHRPLGDIMRARKATYFKSQTNRKT